MTVRGGNVPVDDTPSELGLQEISRIRALPDCPDYLRRMVSRLYRLNICQFEIHVVPGGYQAELSREWMDVLGVLTTWESGRGTP